MFLKSWRSRGSAYSRVQISVSGIPSRTTSPRSPPRPRTIVEKVAARLDRGDILIEGLRIHRDHHVDSAARAEMALFGDAHFEPGRQPLDVRREDIARRDRDAHAQDRAREQQVGAGRT